jgi:hypothetical protein
MHAVVERDPKMGHRSRDGVVCERCGETLEHWEETKCMPSSISVLPVEHEDEEEGADA